MGYSAEFQMGNVAFATGVHFDIVEGEKYLLSTRPAVFIGNHQTELDVLMLGAIFPPYCSVTAKKIAQELAVFGLVHVFVWDGVY